MMFWMAAQAARDLLLGGLWRAGEQGGGNQNVPEDKVGPLDGAVFRGQAQEALANTVADPLKHLVPADADAHRVAVVAGEVVDALFLFNPRHHVVAPGRAGGQSQFACQHRPGKVGPAVQDEDAGLAIVETQLLGENNDMAQRLFASRHGDRGLPGMRVFAEGDRLLGLPRETDIEAQLFGYSCGDGGHDRVVSGEGKQVCLILIRRKAVAVSSDARGRIAPLLVEGDWQEAQVCVFHVSNGGGAGAGKGGGCYLGS